MMHPSKSFSGPGLLETMTITDFIDFRPEVAVIPVGSTEPHGPHLPYGTDTLIADGFTAESVRLANLDGARVLRLPPLPIGNNVNFKGFPFACRIRVETLMAVLADLVEFLREEGIRKVVIVNCHGGNDATIRASLRELFDRHQQEIFLCACGAGSFGGDEYGKLFDDRSPHAGEYETSMILHFAPELVISSAFKPADPEMPAIESLAGHDAEWVRPWHRLMPDSYAGRPDLASAEKGSRFSKACAAGFARFLTELSKEPWHPNFPYPKRDESA
jgi:creatinine amidohydrolase